MKYLKIEALEIGQAYKVNARNFEVAIWTGYRFAGMRYKIVEWFLAEEIHYDEGGTVKPYHKLV